MLGDGFGVADNACHTQSSRHLPGSTHPGVYLVVMGGHIHPDYIANEVSHTRDVYRVVSAPSFLSMPPQRDRTHVLRVSDVAQQFRIIVRVSHLPR